MVVHPDIERYVVAHSSGEPELLAKLRYETERKVLLPRMLSGPLQGRILALLSKMLRPKKILEIGTFTGYSALCLAEGLDKDGMLISIDINEELEDMVRSYWLQSPWATQLHMKIGPALQVIPALEGSFDLVFIDADKVNNEHYFNLVVDRVPAGGLILVDNVLWNGKVANEEFQDKDTNVIRRFNDLVHADPRVENTLLPVRDGLLVLRKI